MSFRLLALGILVALPMVGCRPQPAPITSSVSQPTAVAPVDTTREPNGILFADRTDASGLRFTYQNDEAHSDFSIVESIGGGVAIFDFDRDERLDLLLPGGGAFRDRQVMGLPSGLFRNLGSWLFSDVTKSSLAGDSRHFSHGAIVADYNEDGFDDVLVTGYGGLTFYQNQGDATFREATAEALLMDRLWSSSAAWGDFNGDGVLDLYVAHYVDWSFDKHPVCAGPNEHPRDVCPPREFNGLPGTIYFGNGDGTFRDATQEAGLQPEGKGLGVVVADVDLDGDLDIYVANDTVPNVLYRNDGRGHFEDVSVISGTAFSDRGTPDGSMGTDVGDFNGDGLPDIWVVNYERETNALYRNLGNAFFRHVSQSVGVAAVGDRYVGWGTRFVDLDLDGDEDLIVANGHVIRFPQNTPRLQRPLVLENREGTRFTNVTESAGSYMRSAHEGRGLATGDLDGDGDEDIVISNVNEPAAILSNESTPRNNWLAVRIIGRRATRTAIGARAVVTINGKSMTKQIRGGTSYASTSDTKLHFGCGTAQEADEVTVTLISGSKVTLKNVLCNRILTVIEPGAN